MAKPRCRVCRQVLPAVAFKEKHDGTRTLTCVQCLAEQRLYQQTYRHTHKEQIAKSKQKYRATHKPENSAYQRQYYVRNKERLAVRKREYSQKNRDQERVRSRRYYETNRDKKTAQRRRYYRENRDTVLARQRRYYHDKQARKRGENAITSPGKGGSAKRKQADAAPQHRGVSP